MSSPIRNCVIVGIDETLRIKTRGALDAAVPTAALYMDKGTKTGLTLCHAKIPEVLVLEWDVFPLEEVTSFLQKFRKLTGCMNNHVILVASRQSEALTAVAIEYEAFRVLYQDQLARKVRSAIREAITELSQPTALRTRLLALEQASQRGDQLLLSYTVEQLYQQFPDSPRAKIEYANLCLAQGRFSEAEGVARKALIYEPGSLRVQNVFARSCLHQGKTKEALGILERSEHLSPLNLDRLLMLGDSYLNLNRMDDARKSYENALRVDESNNDAMTGVASVELAEANLNEALTLLRESCTEIERAALFNNAGILASRNGRTDQACSLYQTALRSLSTNRLKARVYFNIGLARERALQYTEAVAEYKKSLEFDSAFSKSRRHSDGLLRMMASGADLLRRPEDLPARVIPAAQLEEFDDLVEELDDDKLDRALNSPRDVKIAAAVPGKSSGLDDSSPSILELAAKERLLKGFKIDVVSADKPKRERS